MALAESRGWLIASDEKQRFRREALAGLGAGRLVTTPGLFLLAIRAGAMSVAEADQAKVILEQHRPQRSLMRDHQARAIRDALSQALGLMAWALQKLAELDARAIA